MTSVDFVVRGGGYPAVADADPEAGPARVLPVAFDVDGTVVDSFLGAMAAAEDILALLGRAVLITNRATMREHFGRSALLERYGEAGLQVLLLHPVVMRVRGMADPPPVFSGMTEIVAEVARATGEPPTFFTAGFRDSAFAALSAAGVRDPRVTGREAGSKTEQLVQWAAGRPGARYVCDTRTDVNRCRDAGLQAVGVAWGYDDLADLERAGALPVRNVADLRAVLLEPIMKENP
jgi:phosphoglycolate phosphatase